MTATRIVKIVGAADGVTRTPHDGRWLVAWNPHTKAGTLALTSTQDRDAATRLDLETICEQWRAQSRKQPLRPDGRPNRPLTAVTIEIVGVGLADGETSLGAAGEADRVP